MRNAYMIAEVMIAVVMAGAILSVFTTINYFGNIQSNMLKQQNTKIILEVIRSRLLKSADDPDGDQYFELLKEDENSTLPVSIGTGTDAWGKRIQYTTIDLGDQNIFDTTYADSNTSISPKANIAGRLLSSGENRRFETNTTNSESQGDDLMLEIGVGELNHFKLYGGSEIAGETRGYNSAIVSGTEPTTPINGTIWYDTSVSKLKIYNESNASWTTF